MNRIKMLREAKGLGLRELAADLERQGYPLSWMTINKSEKPDSNPSWKTIKILSKYFNVSADYLMGTDLSNKTIAAHNENGSSLPPELQLAVEKFYRKQQLEHGKDDEDSKE